MSDGLDALIGLGGEDRDRRGSEGGTTARPTAMNEAGAGVPSLVSIPIDAIVANERQPRERFAEDELVSLAASIAQLGVLQPVLVRQIDENRYELIAGERRWRASRRAGLDAIPALVRAADDLASLEQAVVENLHRADLNALEEAAAYRQLMDEFGLTQEQVAERVGKSRSGVANLIRLLQLPEAVQALIAAGELTAGHARALVAVPDLGLQVELAHRIVDEDLSVRAVETLIRSASRSPKEEPGRDAASDATKPAGVLELERLLAEYLDTRVRVQLSQGRGRLVVDFADLDDLERIYRRLAES